MSPRRGIQIVVNQSVTTQGGFMLKLFPSTEKALARQPALIDVTVSNGTRNFKLNGVDVSSEGVLLKMPLPTPMLNQLLSLCIHYQGEEVNEVIYCQGQSQDGTLGRRLQLLNLSESTRKTLKTLHH